MSRPLTVVIALLVAGCAKASTTATPAPAPAPVTPPVVAAPPVTPPPTTPPPTTPPAGAFDPTGTYELQLTFGGNPLPVTMELWKEKDLWFGYVGNPNLGSADLTQFSMDGRWFKGTFVTQGGPTFVFEATVAANNTVSGKWTGNGDGSNFSGRKTK